MTTTIAFSDAKTLSLVFYFYFFPSLTFAKYLQGVVYPGIHAVWSRWAPPAERTRLGSFAFSGSFVGTVVGYPMCGWLAKNYGWPSTFYVPGIYACSGVNH